MTRPAQPLFELGNLVGPTTESLLHGDGLTVLHGGDGNAGESDLLPCGADAGGVASWWELGIRIFGYSGEKRVEVFKTLLFLLPVEGAIWLVWRRGMPRSTVRRWIVCGLLLAPFGVLAFLADVVNLQVEEGYSYSLLALGALALLLFCLQEDARWPWGRAILVCAGGGWGLSGEEQHGTCGASC